ncbi:MAG: hypothetical protein Q9209_001248 [Squamulea sp. 1 TL-2023]
MLNGKIYVVTSPELVNAVYRNSRVLAFNPCIAQIGKRITGHDEATSGIVQHNLNGESGLGCVMEIHNYTIAALADQENIQNIASTMLEGILVHLDRLEQVGKTGLFAWIRHAVTICSTTAIYGPDNPLEKDQDSLDEAVCLTLWLISATYKVRKNVAAATIGTIDIWNVMKSRSIAVSKAHDDPDDLPQQQFPFGKLPGKIRNEIYRLCLVSELPLTIVPSNPTATGAKSPRSHVYSRSRLRVLDAEDLRLNLVRVSRTVYEEVVPLLYSCNTFQFPGPDCWKIFLRFDHALTDFSHDKIRKINIHFPIIQRRSYFISSIYSDYHYGSSQCPGKFSKAACNGLEILKSLPCLEVLTMYLTVDILNSDIFLLQKIRCSVNRACQIFIDGGLQTKRPFCIGVKAMEKMRKWHWEMRGAWELVDKNHRLSDEKIWAKEAKEQAWFDDYPYRLHSDDDTSD